MKSNRHDWIFRGALLGLPVFCLLISLLVGNYTLQPPEIGRILLQGITGTQMTDNKLAYSIIWETRLPRIAAAMLAGAGLAAAGAVFQGIFRNPLASPYTLGVSNGAGFGAALAILLSWPLFAVQGAAMVFSFVAIASTFALSRKEIHSTVNLVLAGLIVGNLFAALVAILKFTADPFEKLPAIVFWLMGSLASVSAVRLWEVLPFYLLSMAVLLAYRWRINVLCLGEAEARSFGVDVKKDRTVVILACSLVTAVVVGFSGIIGWVGLVVPHFARIWVGPDYRKLLPACICLGSSYLLLIDDCCRALTSLEIPLGAVTALLGTPIFAWLLWKKKVNW